MSLYDRFALLTPSQEREATPVVYEPEENMLNSYWKKLRATVNANEVCGHAPGTLLCVSHGAGGGFVGAPERLTVWVRRKTVLHSALAEYDGWAPDLFPRQEFPEESANVKYSIWEEDGTFYLEEHRRKYGWTIPVTQEEKERSE